MKQTVVALLLATMAVGATAQEVKECRDFIEVQGRAEEEVVPDEIYLRITIEEKEFKKPLETIEQDMSKQLASIGIDVEKRLEVQNMYSSMQKRFLKSDNITATRSYTLMVISMAQANKAFEVFDQLKIANVRFERAQLSRNHPIYVELYTKAAANAKINAAAIAKGLEVKAGKAIYAQSNYNSYPVVYAQSRMMKSMVYESDMAGGGEESPELNFKKIKVECTLQARFLIEIGASF